MIYAIAQLFWGHQRPVPLIPSHLYPYTPPFRSRSIPSIDTLHLTPENVCATLAATSNFMPRTLEIYGNLKISPAAFRGNPNDDFIVTLTHRRGPSTWTKERIYQRNKYNLSYWNKQRNNWVNNPLME